MPIKLAIPLVVLGVGSAAASSYGIYFDISKNGKNDGTPKGNKTEDTPATEGDGSATPQTKVTEQQSPSTPAVTHTAGEDNHSVGSPQSLPTVQPQVSTGASDSKGTEQKSREQASEVSESSGDTDTTKASAGSSGPGTEGQAQPAS